MFSVDLVTAGKLSDLRQASLASKNVNYLHVFEASKGQNLSKIPLFQLWQRWWKHGICHHLARIHEQNGFSSHLSLQIWGLRIESDLRMQRSLCLRFSKCSHRWTKTEVQSFSRKIISMMSIPPQTFTATKTVSWPLLIETAHTCSHHPEKIASGHRWVCGHATAVSWGMPELSPPRIDGALTVHPAIDRAFASGLDVKNFSWCPNPALFRLRFPHGFLVCIATI